MDIQAARQQVYKAIDRLRAKGIDVTIRPSRSQSIKSTVQKYGDMPGRLPVQQWEHVTIRVDNDRDIIAVNHERTRLIDQGIVFDTSGSSIYRDWEIDWSLRYDPAPESTKAAQNVVEDVIQSIGRDGFVDSEELTWKDRLQVERNELQIRLNKLETFVKSPKCFELDEPNKMLLYQQVFIMQNYLTILDQRVMLSNITSQVSE